MSLTERIERGEFEVKVIMVDPEHGYQNAWPPVRDELLRLAKTGEQMQWIQLSKQKPPYGEQVLICANDKVYTATLFQYGETEWWSVNNTGNAAYRGATEMPVVRAKAIKYWMHKPPLPEPPNG